MTRRLIPATFALGAVLMLMLAGCGGSDEPTAVDAGSDPTTASSTAASSASGDTPSSSTESSVMVDARWPADCPNRVASSFDYGHEPRGWKTPEEAVAHSENPAIPAGAYVLAPEEAHGATQVWVVDEATNTIMAAVSVFQGSTGFYVDGITTCG